MKFSHMGIPFPLFDAPVEEAVEYVGSSVCVICGERTEHGFELDIGADILVPCSSCESIVGLDANDQLGRKCPSCSTEVRWPYSGSECLIACYACLRAGKAALSKDTELGMVTWEQAISGVTHGVPGGLLNSDFESVPVGDGWFGARVPSSHINELLRTPSFHTIQGETWLFCCRRPMVYLGAWTKEQFIAHSPDGDGEAFFNSIVENIDPSCWLESIQQAVGVYVFKCEECGQFRANWDMD